MRLHRVEVGARFGYTGIEGKALGEEKNIACEWYYIRLDSIWQFFSLHLD